jgi:hypothetical protein
LLPVPAISAERCTSGDWQAIGWTTGAMLAALDRLVAPENFGARIRFGHDPEFWRSVPRLAEAIT